LSAAAEFWQLQETESPQCKEEGLEILVLSVELREPALTTNLAAAT
jgi:hypothetical protein